MTALTHHPSPAFGHQENRINKYRRSLDAFGFFNQLTSDMLFDEVESQLPEHRERLFPPTETLSLFLSQAVSQDRSCQNTVNQTAVTRLVDGLPLCSTATGGYCKARQRLGLDMVRHLARFTGQQVNKDISPKWCWQRRNVKIVDGTTISMPDTSANQDKYPQISNVKAGLGFPICMMVGITCLSSGALLDAAICRYGGKGNSEQSLLRTLLNTLNNKDILLADALYASYYLLVELQNKGVDALFEQHGSRQKTTDFSQGKKLGSKDHLIVLERPKRRPQWMSTAQFEALPSSITVRELRVGKKTLVTTLCCPKFAPKKALETLYKSRWHVELDIRNH